MFNKLYLNIILLNLFLGTCAMGDLSDFLPAEINSWKQQEIQTYNAETLFQYINGGAELYISYGFEKMMSCIFVRENNSDIHVDIFDMQNSNNAFGIFLHFRETIDSTYGQGSQYMYGNLLFWKDRYFVSILASPETEESKKAFELIGKHIADKIENTGTIPTIINLIPKENLIKESIRYFRHYIWLNSYYFISDKNILNIDQDTEVVLAKYQHEKQQSILLIVSYKNETDSNKAIENFIEQYLPDLRTNTILQLEDDSWVGYQIQGKLISIVFSSPSEAEVNKLFEFNSQK